MFNNKRIEVLEEKVKKLDFTLNRLVENHGLLCKDLESATKHFNKTIRTIVSELGYKMTLQPETFKLKKKSTKTKSKE